MSSEEIHKLIEKYNNQTASSEEKKIVEALYDKINGDAPNFGEAELINLKQDIFTSVINTIENNTQPQFSKIKSRKLYISIAWAAVFAGLIFGSLFIYLNTSNSHSFSRLVKKKKNEIKPGGNNAILKLADGTELILNKAADGQIANQSGIKVTKTKSGELLYTFTSGSKPQNVQINTVTTPRGGQYHLILIDGTEVWLNASSSITFPTAFTGNDRKVKVTGEVYFEVSKNKLKPFIVNTTQSEIKVLGTHFNINAYEDEYFQKTTLLEGSIEIKKGGQLKLLIPGEQSNISESSNAIQIKQVEDLDAIIAWKNGYFQFLDSDLPSFMRQISRWYNTEVSYNGAIPTKEYTGKIPRNVKIETLIQMLSYSGIHCRVENNQITVNSK